MKTGTYYVQMHSETGKGAYSVSVAQIADDYTNSAVHPGIMAVNGSTTAAFEANNDSDWFKVQLVAGQSYSTSVLTGGTSSYFGFSSFLDSTGFPLGQTFTATASGIHYVQAIGFRSPAISRADTR